MRRPSSRMRQAFVTALYHTWGKDSDGGRTILSTKTVPNLICSVDPIGGETAVDETGRWTTVNNYTLRFTTDPLLSAHDEVTWKEIQNNQTHHLVVLSTANRMGRSVTYEVSCTERL